jgi:hypothetical protein
MAATHDQIERLLAEKGSELLRSMMQAHYDARAANERQVKVAGADGVERTQVRKASRQLETLFGTVEIDRHLYQAPGSEGLAPLDAALGLPSEKYSLEVRRLIAEGEVAGVVRWVVELIAKRTGASVSKRQVEELTVRAAQDFDAFYADRLTEAEATNDLLILSFDGKGIAMRHADLREATRLTSGEKRNRKRMAQVATVYTLAPWKRTAADVLHTLRPDDLDSIRPRPTHKRVWASVEHTAQEVVDDAFTEALRREPNQHRRWVVLVDGEREQIHGGRDMGAAAAPRAADRHPRRRGRQSLRGMIARHGLDEQTATPVMKCASYLVKHTRLLQYDRALADGLPIATRRDRGSVPVILLYALSAAGRGSPAHRGFEGEGRHPTVGSRLRPRKNARSPARDCDLAETMDSTVRRSALSAAVKWQRRPGWVWSPSRWPWSRPEESAARSCVTVRSGLLRQPAQIGQRRTR